MIKKDEKKVIIELQNACKYYYMGHNILKAVNGVSLKIREGEFVAIMGPSGSGKSTMMNLIGSLDVPTKGKIFLDGEDISTLDESDLAQIRGQKIGFIFQSFNLINNLTAKENVMIPMIFQGYDIDERGFRADELIKLVELTPWAAHSPGELSGGQQQRVAIARALANSPEVVLADEPTGNLDTKTGETVMDFLNGLNKKGKTIVMVTHDPDLAKEYADIVYWLRDGKIEKVTKKTVKRRIK
ncbi:MAG: ABC transporter ATP-binding protein [Candidatus Woesearchaeota archaeon]